VKFFSLFFFFSRLKFLHLFLAFSLAHSFFLPFSLLFLSSFLCLRPSWRPICPSFIRKEEKKRPGCTFFLSSSFFFFFFFFIYSSLGYTHVYIQTHTHTRYIYIHINNGIRNDQLFVDAVWRVVGLLFFLEKKFDDQQPIIRCF
jgi:hypothetical protein